MSALQYLKLPSFAKINWVLHVLGRRPDGLHDLHTILQTITLKDDLVFQETSDGNIEILCDAPGVPCDERNLIYQAAIALRERYATKKGVSVKLEKRIPMGGGLGGGSSNAAVTLLGLNYLWDINASIVELHEIAASLGADVPFFLQGGTGVASGSGREVAPTTEKREDQLLILSPAVSISTAEAYAALDSEALTKENGKRNLSICREDDRNLNSGRAGLANDFEPVVFGLYPEIKRARDKLVELGSSGTLLAGSGSSLFAIFDNRDAQEGAAAVLRGETGWRVFLCATLGPEGYRRALGPCFAAVRAGMVSPSGTSEIGA